MPDTTVLEQLRGQLVVSCQAPPGDPLRSPDHIAAIAAAAVAGGAAAVRINSPEDVRAVRSRVDVPIIGLWKDGTEGVYITPTPRHVTAVVDAGADIVALDATGRPRPGGATLEECVEAAHAAGALVMADVSVLEEGLAAEKIGCDLVGTTLSGYTPYSRQDHGPDLDLVADLAARLTLPVVAEGRIWTPEEAVAALRNGAWCVVVGTAITRPGVITARFADAVTAAAASVSPLRDEPAS
ncbi:N-acetylmannosamine-6-phosphate 2-epimerase [Microbispora corallina]|uniref:Putative N-acetylmannosamine-6-phosphate 2-epimerase n=1 Tax=Microbispora corallina TaxID=83302 RepID=A0ABQ4G6Z5_9ACTN|nr:N-acetylmannosamine-6-phosphate 2-epimerase [Microbispora corallina]GIH42804.1 putative N-acetylmannosamine-6-phosphate 2-epimerase [Microbispora corallina]